MEKRSRHDMIILGITETESGSQHTTRSSAALVQHVKVELALADVAGKIVDALQPKATKDFYMPPVNKR